MTFTQRSYLGYSDTPNVFQRSEMFNKDYLTYMTSVGRTVELPELVTGRGSWFDYVSLQTQLSSFSDVVTQGAVSLYNKGVTNSLLNTKDLVDPKVLNETYKDSGYKFKQLTNMALAKTMVDRYEQEKALTQQLANFQLSDPLSKKLEDMGLGFVPYGGGAILGSLIGGLPQEYATTLALTGTGAAIGYVAGPLGSTTGAALGGVAEVGGAILRTAARVGLNSSKISRMASLIEKSKAIAPIITNGAKSASQWIAGTHSWYDSANAYGTLGGFAKRVGVYEALIENGASTLISTANELRQGKSIDKALQEAQSNFLVGTVTTPIFAGGLKAVKLGVKSGFDHIQNARLLYAKRIADTRPDLGGKSTVDPTDGRATASTPAYTGKGAVSDFDNDVSFQTQKLEIIERGNRIEKGEPAGLPPQSPSKDLQGSSEALVAFDEVFNDVDIPTRQHILAVTAKMYQADQNPDNLFTTPQIIDAENGNSTLGEVLDFGVEKQNAIPKNELVELADNLKTEDLSNKSATELVDEVTKNTQNISQQRKLLEALDENPYIEPDVRAKLREVHMEKMGTIGIEGTQLPKSTVESEGITSSVAYEPIVKAVLPDAKNTNSNKSRIKKDAEAKKPTKEKPMEKRVELMEENLKEVGLSKNPRNKTTKKDSAKSKQELPPLSELSPYTGDILNEGKSELDGWIPDEDIELQQKLIEELSDKDIAVLTQPETQEAAIDYEGCININGKD